MEYAPTGRNGKLKSPLSFAVPALANPVLLLVTATEAPGTTAPEASWMERLIVPLATCPCNEMREKQQNSRNPRKAFNFMTPSFLEAAQIGAYSTAIISHAFMPFER